MNLILTGKRETLSNNCIGAFFILTDIIFSKLLNAKWKDYLFILFFIYFYRIELEKVRTFNYNKGW